jgi:uncharacterized protein (TIGR02001 family)
MRPDGAGATVPLVHSLALGTQQPLACGPPLPLNQEQHMKKALMTALIAASAALPALAAAQGARSDWSMSGNVSIVSDYRFRSISQTFNLPAIQGGFDLGHAAGFYVGTWASNVSGNQYIGGASMEWDFYGGYRMDLGRNTQLDLGFIYYYFPGAKSLLIDGQRRYDTTEVYVGATWGGLTAKLNYAISDSFGLVDSSGSYYADLTYVYPWRRTTNFIAHVGMASFNNFDRLDYTDYKLGVTHEALGITWGLSYIGNNAEDAAWEFRNQSDGVFKSVSKDTFVVSATKVF